MNIVLGITGSVATTVAPKLYHTLVASGHNVEIVATKPAMYFLDPDFLWSVDIYQDKNEWPEGGYHRNDPVKHIEFRDWADMLVVAPLTANTLAKMANGIADNFLSCIIRAWPKQKPMILAPAMNTEMWIDPITMTQIHSIYDRFPKTCVVYPVEKKLACGDTGVGAMADIDTIVKMVNNDCF
jgi:phosphopantothenoylcysteine decarboxylase